MRFKIACFILASTFAAIDRRPCRCQTGGPRRPQDSSQPPYRERVQQQWRLDLAMQQPNRALRSWSFTAAVVGGGQVQLRLAPVRRPRQYQDFAAWACRRHDQLSSSDEAPFPAALEDCKCTVRWLRAHAHDYNLDPKQIGAYGNSAGGHLAMLLGMIGTEGGLEGDGPHQRNRASCRQP